MNYMNTKQVDAALKVIDVARKICEDDSAVNSYEEMMAIVNNLLADLDKAVKAYDDLKT